MNRATRLQTTQTTVIARAKRAIQYSTSVGDGPEVLDHPLSRMMTTGEVQRIQISNSGKIIALRPSLRGARRRSNPSRNKKKERIASSLSLLAKTASCVPDSIFKQPGQTRHCEPTGRANARPMTGSAKQSTPQQKERTDCFVAIAPRNDG